ncbi:lmo0937 family membrane protein [Tumidithrix helvetica PCC 7403]|uniref:Lmo0937 family membrane protein n=1 Tax=Tumidithrix elongata BACA0141 TaxID=2716417 RepID=A0AAW9PXZ4_9CYAN|nr:lmo0937 family membrane protein [Tumidithrix elongata RA019]
MLWSITVVLVVLWALGFGISFGGGLIHILLVLALISVVYNLVSGRSVL